MPAMQLEFPLQIPAPVAPGEALASFLATELGRPVRLTLTSNRTSMLSYREHGKTLAVRLRRELAGAGERERAALVRFLSGNGTGVGKVLEDYLVAHAAPREPRDPPRPAGRFHHLGDIFTELNTHYFHEAAQARITWGAAGGRRYRRTIQLGCYVSEESLIRIHPALDQAFVPRHYVAWIVFHEMLHEVFGVARQGSRRCVHPPEFIAIEQSYPQYELCKQWESDNLYRLLRFRLR
jgi:hypothetical protein